MATYEDYIADKVELIKQDILDDPELVYIDNCDVSQLAAAEAIILFDETMMTPEFLLATLIAHPEILSGDNHHARDLRKAAAEALCMASVPLIADDILAWGEAEGIDLNLDPSPSSYRG